MKLIKINAKKIKNNYNPLAYFIILESIITTCISL
jgi:hypothetical protein